MGEAATYWSTIVTIVPVLSVGFILEYRFLAKGTSEAAGFFRRSRTWRVVFAIVLLVVTALLLASFTISIVALRSGYPASGWRVAVVELGVSLAVGGAIFGPAGLLATALLADTVNAVYRRLPFSPHARLIREVRANERETEEWVRELRSARLDTWISLADKYIRHSQIHRRVMRLPLGKTRAERAVLEEGLAVLNEMRENLEERMAVSGDGILERVRELRARAEATRNLNEADLERYRVLLAEASSRN